ncbi:MAG: FUSC family protein [Chitinophagaceae bacterium]|nr:FUSC family protein [Bacteroidota bacterium]MCC6257242.1 FUSC family protein [Chitinophagaceae bacterium]
MHVAGEQKLRYFLFSQHLADGIRITLEIAIPAFVLAYFGFLDAGFNMALGALCLSICDAPGPVEHKKNGMWYGNLFVFAMALLAGLFNGNILWMSLLIAGGTFFFSMVSVYGARAASVGTAALLAMILSMTKISTPLVALTDALLILAGGLWYMLVAMIFFKFTPYRPAQRLLGECIYETSNYLRIKAALYNIQSNYETEYGKLLAQQVVVNEKQEAIRELLFTNRMLTREASRQGKILILTFSDLMDLYEQINATWYDYESLRNKYGATGILGDISAILHKLADEMNIIGLAIQSHSGYTQTFNHIDALNSLKEKVDALGEGGVSTLVLKKVIINLRTLGEKINDVARYFQSGFHKSRKLLTDSEYKKFVSHQQVNKNILVNNLHFESASFRHAIRVMVTCLLGYAITEAVSYGNHSYWVLLTIIVILKPGFGLTKKRNTERLVGTLIGAILGLTLTFFFPNKMVLSGLIIFFMLGTYTFIRINYQVMVIFMTPYVIILFYLLGLNTWAVVEERIIDTAFGGLLAFMANYLLFPHWEAKHISLYLTGVLKANINYLRLLKDLLQGHSFSMVDYKLARKVLFVNMANLAAAFHRMLSEPSNKQKSSREIYQLVVLNHVLASNVASLTAHISGRPGITATKHSLIQVQSCINSLEAALLQFKPGYTPLPHSPIHNPDIEEKDRHLSQQLDFMKKLCSDITSASLKISKEAKNPVISAGEAA